MNYSKSRSACLNMLRGGGGRERWCQMWYWWQVSVLVSCFPLASCKVTVERWDAKCHQVTVTTWPLGERIPFFFLTQILLLCFPPLPPLLPSLHSNFFSPSCFLSCLIHLSFLNLWFLSDHKQVPLAALACAYIIPPPHTHKTGYKATTFFRTCSF